MTSFQFSIWLAVALGVGVAQHQKVVRVDDRRRQGHWGRWDSGQRPRQVLEPGPGDQLSRGRRRVREGDFVTSAAQFLGDRQQP
jgi:hypothetical protein